MTGHNATYISHIPHIKTISSQKIRKWYNFLVPSESHPHKALLDHLEPTADNLIVCAEVDGHRYYTCFKDYLEYWIFFQEVPLPRRCFYEIISGPQKPHFDIDISQTEISSDQTLQEKGRQVLEEVVSQIVAIFLEWNLPLDLSTQLLIFSSHAAEKCSYHVVIDGYYHLNNLEAKAFYTLMAKRLSPSTLLYLDAKVYSSRQQFRLWGCHKYGQSHRVKILVKEWQFHQRKITCLVGYQVAEENRALQIFEASLVGVVHSCRLLPILIKEEPSVLPIQGEEIKTQEVPLCLQKAKSFFGGYKADFPFEVRNIQGTLINLTRLRPSYCRSCKRVHEHENAFILVVREGQTLHLYFNCRRTEEKVYLGSLITQNCQMEPSVIPVTSLSPTTPDSPVKTNLTEITQEDIPTKLNQLSKEYSQRQTSSIAIATPKVELSHQLLKEIDWKILLP